VDYSKDLSSHADMLGIQAFLTISPAMMTRKKMTLVSP